MVDGLHSEREMLRRHSITAAALTALIILAVALVGFLFKYKASSNMSTVMVDGTTYKTAASFASEAGVKLSGKPDNVLIYVLSDDSYLFSTKTLTESDPLCGPRYGPLGSIGRITKASLSEQGSFYSTSDMRELVSKGAAKEFSTYYLVYSAPQAPCSSKASVTALQQLEQKSNSPYKLFSLIEKPKD